MPFVAKTPESQLGRTDSKNPETTCRGITSGGRPCRRPLTAAAPGGSPPAPSPARLKRAKNRLHVEDDPSDPDLYCWQHKDQAASSAHSSPGPRRTDKPILESRESVDTLIDRLGIVEQQQKQSGGRKTSGAVRPSEKEDHPQQYPQQQQQQQPYQKKKTRSIFCCCFSIPIHEDDEEEEAAQPQPPQRPKPRPIQSAPTPLPGTTKPYPPSSSRPGSSSLAPPSSSGGPRSRRPSQTSQFMALIPGHTSPQTASQLLAELAKPPSAQDEPGYIYIFWLTPESAGAKPPTDAARSLLASSGSDSRSGGSSHLRPVDAQRQRRPSDVVANFAASSRSGGAAGSSRSRGGAGAKDDGGGKNKPKTILLKIGRASNVHRRLTEWQRQCGYDLDLIRYYPYVPSSSQQQSSANTPAGSRTASFSSTNRRVSGGSRPSSSNANNNNNNNSGSGDGVRKTPHSHKVERLVHIELTGLGLRAYDGAGGDGSGGGACEACGRTHREWFEVEASRQGISVVDEIVRRWCDWDEGRL